MYMHLFVNRNLTLKTTCFPKCSFARRSFSADPINSNTVLYLRNDLKGTDVYVVGTAHVSKKSAEQVREIINLVKPTTVMIELDPVRAEKLKRGGSKEEANYMNKLIPYSNFTKNTGWSGFFNNFGPKMIEQQLKRIYEYMRALGFIPGGEFLAAIEESEKLGCKLVYGDQDAKETFRRIWENISIKDLYKLVTNPVTDPELLELFNDNNSMEDLIEKLKDRNKARKMMEVMNKFTPGIYKALVEERDVYMTNNLANNCDGNTVAVVGLAHLDGIERLWTSHGSKSTLPHINK